MRNTIIEVFKKKYFFRWMKLIPLTLTKASPNMPKGPEAGKIIWNAMA
jgi:hypothetical protein